MKKLLLILLLLFLSAKTSFAQEVFPLSGAKWTEAITYDEGKTYNYFSYVLQGDTIEDGILRSKLYYIPDINRKDSVLMGFIHIQENKVFFKTIFNEDDPYASLLPIFGLCFEEYPVSLLYDFSLSIEDVFYPCGTSNPGFCETNPDICETVPDFCENYPDICETNFYLHVLDIDSIELGGVKRKRMAVGKNEHISDYWVEGMGGLRGLFYHKHTAIPTSENISKHFVCFTQDNELIYLNPDYSECPIPQFNAIPEVKTNLLRVFPNPMKSVVTIQSDQPLQAIQIYDISGLLLHKQACNGELQTVVERESLLQGTYFMKITFQTGETRTEKLIIQ
jgi:hypothetical protein